MGSKTEATFVYTRSGQKRNGSLLYSIRPVQEALDQFYERQMAQAEMAAAKQRAAAKLAPVRPCEPLCAALERAEGPCPTQGVGGVFEPLLEDFQGTKEKAG